LYIGLRGKSDNFAIPIKQPSPYAQTTAIAVAQNSPSSQTTSDPQNPRYKTFLIEINIPYGSNDLNFVYKNATLTDYTRKFFNSLDKEVSAILMQNQNCKYKSREIVNGRIYLRTNAYGGDTIQLPSAASVVLDCNQ